MPLVDAEDEVSGDVGRLGLACTVMGSTTPTVGKTNACLSRIISGLVALAVAAVVLGCGSSSDSTQEGTESSSVATSEPLSAGYTGDNGAGPDNGGDSAILESGEDVGHGQVVGSSNATPATADTRATADAAPADTASTADTAATADTATTPDDAATRDTANVDDPTETVTEGAASEPVKSTPREDVTSALRDPDNSAHPEPLVDLSEIRSVVPPDAIPALDDPAFEPAESVDWLPTVEPVLALDIGGDARAYPLRIMTWHELVNGTVGGMPVTVSYCPLCNSAVAYDRRVTERILDFGTSGSLLNSSLVMYDRQTESLWSHYTGEAVVGHLTGTQLDLIPVQTVSFGSFLSAHPDGLVLSADTGHTRRYGQNPYDFYDSPESLPFLFSGSYDDRLDPMSRVVALREGGEATVIPYEVLSEQNVIAVTVGGRELVVLHTSGTASALDTSVIADGRDVGATGVFDRIVNGREIKLTATANGNFTDVETGHSYDILGRRTNGGQTGSGEVDGGGHLPAVEHLDTFWFAVAAFYADAEIVGQQ